MEEWWMRWKQEAQDACCDSVQDFLWNRAAGYGKSRKLLHSKPVLNYISKRKLQWQGLSAGGKTGSRRGESPTDPCGRNPSGGFSVQLRHRPCPEQGTSQGARRVTVGKMPRSSDMPPWRMKEFILTPADAGTESRFRVWSWAIAAEDLLVFYFFGTAPRLNLNSSQTSTPPSLPLAL
jgi:hypothetical protein